MDVFRCAGRILFTEWVHHLRSVQENLDPLLSGSVEVNEVQADQKEDQHDQRHLAEESWGRPPIRSKYEGSENSQGRLSHVNCKQKHFDLAAARRDACKDKFVILYIAATA